MKAKKLIATAAAVLALAIFASGAFASVVHKVVPGETMWKIAVKYNVGLSEIVKANSAVKNPSLIYPGQELIIPTVDKGTASFEEQVIKLTNSKRAENGLPPLKANWELSRVARYKSDDMAAKKYFSHTSPTYGDPGKMIKNFGISYRTMGENIAMGQRTPQEVVNAWMNSPGHRANILNKAFTEIGVGFSQNGYYWTQMFIGK